MPRAKAIISVLLLSLNLFAFGYRMLGSGSPDFDTAKEKRVAGKEDHACVKGLV